MRLRTIANVLACLLLLASGFAVFLLLIPVPDTLAIDMPKDLQCQYFAASRRGWGCARFDNFTQQPLAVSTAITVSLLCASWLKHSFGAPVRATVLSVWSFFIGLAGLVGLVYFLQGHARLLYGALCILALCVAGLYFFSLDRILRKNFSSPAIDPERSKSLDAGISIEIAERKAEQSSARRGEQ